MKILAPPYPTWARFDAIDPGRDYWAEATFENGILVWCKMRAWDDGWVAWPNIPNTNVVIEMPQLYRHGKHRAKDIADLTFSAGAIAARYSNVVRYLPAEWKGQVDKEIHHERILRALNLSERRIVDGLKKKDSKHILDAVGLGLFHLNRLGR